MTDDRDDRVGGMLTTTSNWLIEVRCRMGSPPSGLWSQHVVRAQHHPAAHNNPADVNRIVRFADGGDHDDDNVHVAVDRGV